MKKPEKLEKIVIRFAGDSGDGMQLTGDRFTSEAALFGNDLATQPSYPAEIRAPQGTLPGVSSFQIQIADYDILTAGDRPDVLVAMNPAALKANIIDLPIGGLVIANSDEFTKRNLAKVGYDNNPLESGELSDYKVEAVADDHADPGRRRGDRCHEEGRPARQEHVRAGSAVLDVRPADRDQRAIHPGEVRPQARHRRGERAGAQGRVELRRDHRSLRRHLRGVAGEAARR